MYFYLFRNNFLKILFKNPVLLFYEKTMRERLKINDCLGFHNPTFWFRKLMVSSAWFGTQYNFTVNNIALINNNNNDNNNNNK